MDYDHNKIDDAALALIGAYCWMEHGAARAWKGLDFEVSNRLFEKGLIADPKNTDKSFWLTAEGLDAAKAAAERLFGKSAQS